ncbi:hypothetical protein WN51_01605 [Melipona quadrifasciata]|uniref:Uncharacterized protein n=1 Tax=Melipona quadrifasciata TaxID=166423 RepID=A0A0N0U432_9HYME|nr:hypothetical protein WN51_01605 [Melipona quadrifasciata]
MQQTTKFSKSQNLLNPKKSRQIIKIAEQGPECRVFGGRERALAGIAWTACGNDECGRKRRSRGEEAAAVHGVTDLSPPITVQSVMFDAAVVFYAATSKRKKGEKEIARSIRLRAQRVVKWPRLKTEAKATAKLQKISLRKYPKRSTYSQLETKLRISKLFENFVPEIYKVEEARFKFAFNNTILRNQMEIVVFKNSVSYIRNNKDQKHGFKCRKQRHLMNHDKMTSDVLMEYGMEYGMFQIFLTFQS